MRRVFHFIKKTTFCSEAEISAMPSHAINKNINPGIRNRWGGRFQDVSQSQRFLCGDVTMEMGIRPIIGRDCRNCSRAQDTSQSKGWCLRAKRWCSVCQGRKPSQESRTTNALFQLWEQHKSGIGLEKQKALEMALLVSFVNKQAPRTARAIEMHLPANFCNVTSSTISRDKMSRKKAINSSFEEGGGVMIMKAWRHVSEIKPKKGNFCSGTSTDVDSPIQ